MSQFWLENSGLLTLMEPCSLGEAPRNVTTHKLTRNILRVEVQGGGPVCSQRLSRRFEPVLVGSDCLKTHQFSALRHRVVEWIKLRW